MTNIACRVFLEQLNLVKELPEQERATVLYTAICNAFNQFENQNENQNENAYVSVSASALGNTVINLLSKNIICKEFSNNYGGKRINSGRPRKEKNQIENQFENQNENQIEKNNTSVAVKQPKISESTKFNAGFQNWKFDMSIRAVAAKYWEDDTIRAIEIDFSCKEYNTETSISSLLEIYPADKDRSIEIAFNTFWAKYPKQRAGAKDKARKKFVSIIKAGRATVDEILQGVMAYCMSEEVADGYAKGCVAWLNDDRWLVNYKPAKVLKKIEQAQKLNEWAND